MPHSGGWTLCFPGGGSLRRVKANCAASVFIGISLDGFIARENGELDWLTESAAALGDTGYDDFMASVDTLVIGRNTYETIQAFGEWPYAGKRVLVLSSTVRAVTAPDATVHATLDDIVEVLNRDGARRAYVDGGATIQSFLRAGLLTDLTITHAPVLLGSGVPLFGPLERDVQLTLTGMRELGAGFTQTTYDIVRGISE
nr:dihydrofolate reductase family protein [Leifsonia psychrotolerans]